MDSRDWNSPNGEIFVALLLLVVALLPASPVVVSGSRSRRTVSLLVHVPAVRDRVTTDAVGFRIHYALAFHFRFSPLSVWQLGHGLGLLTAYGAYLGAHLVLH